jgi:arylsulfatase A-like enzyme
MIRWPKQIKGDRVSNEIISLEDCVPTLMAAVGEPDIKEKLLKGHAAAGNNYKVHLDGYNFLPYLTGQEDKGPRKEFFAYVDDGTLGAVRYDRWKFHFSVQEHSGFDAWMKAQKPLKAPMLIDLRADPFEAAHEDSSYYTDWLVRHMFAFVPLNKLVAEHAATFKEFPVRQASGSFTPRQ